MARRLQTAEAIESPAKVSKNIEVFDFFFAIGYMVVSVGFKSLVHSKLVYPYLLFSLAMAIFLTSKSFYNKKRRNYESLFFLLTKDRKVYRPVVSEIEKVVDRGEES